MPTIILFKVFKAIIGFQVDKIRTLGEKKTYKYLGILETDTIKQEEMIEKIKKSYLKRTRKLLKTKLWGRNLIWAVFLVRYSGPFWKWTREELKQMDQRIRKLMTIRHYILETTLTDYMYQEKREEEDLAAVKSTLTHRYDSRTT